MFFFPFCDKVRYVFIWTKMDKLARMEGIIYEDFCTKNFIQKPVVENFIKN